MTYTSILSEFLSNARVLWRSLPQKLNPRLPIIAPSAAESEMANRMKEDEKNEKIIRGLLKQPANRRCMNCNSLSRGREVVPRFSGFFGLIVKCIVAVVEYWIVDCVAAF
ncbi:hypothetical protein ACLOJK_037927 [Asimina triloba]